MKYAAAVLVAFLSACANGIEIPSDAKSLEGSEEMLAEVDSWQAQGFGDASRCPAPYIAVVSTAEFEAHWRAIGGEANYPSCGRGTGETNANGYCLNAYTEVDPDAAAHNSVVYVDSRAGVDSGLLQHEIKHVLYACTHGVGDPLHEDHPVWGGDVHALAGQ